MAEPPASLVQLRSHRMGDIGWAIQRQAELYAEEFRYLPIFEDYVVKSFVPFLDQFDPRKDALWVAEDGGERVGCIAIQHDAERTGWCKLRWYFVERHARGTGIGTALIEEALAFSRNAGYIGVWLWTVDDLAAARRQYERLGFRLKHTESHVCEWAPWGREQRWELRLA